MDKVVIPPDVSTKISFSGPTLVRNEGSETSISFFVSDTGNDNSWFEVGYKDPIVLEGDVFFKQVSDEDLTIVAFEV